MRRYDPRISAISLGMFESQWLCSEFVAIQLVLVIFIRKLC